MTWTARKLTDDQLDELVELREKGWSYHRLAKRYGVSDGAIQYQCLKLGVISPFQRQYPRTDAPATSKATKRRDGRTQRRFTADEDARMLALASEGKSNYTIARLIGRPRTSVLIRMLTIATNEVIAEEGVDA